MFTPPKFLSQFIVRKIFNEAINILSTIGIELHNEQIASTLFDNGATLKNKRVLLNDELIFKSIRSTPKRFKLYDTNGKQTHDFYEHNVYFTPGSTGLYILDHETQRQRNPTTHDYISYLKVVSQLEHIASQSTAFIPRDIHEKCADSYRLFLSLLFCEKPIVTGTFTIESFEVMKNFQIAVRGDEKRLREKPLTIFSACPTSPLKWSNVTSQNVVDCAKYGIPIEFISMPLSGLVAPVTLLGSLVQHTAETLSGIVISQTTRPGAPILYGGSPAIFDMKHSTTPMGAIETMMIDCAYNEIGKYLELPTQAYISLSDSKQLDAQAGLESGIGAILAGMSGINSISGPGMLDFESCHSIEKLVLDNQICGMVFRLLRGVEIKDTFPMTSIFEKLIAKKNLLDSDHTCEHFRTEQFFPSDVIDRKVRDNSIRDFGLTQRAHQEVEHLIRSYEPFELNDDVEKELTELMTTEAKRYGQEKNPEFKTSR